VKERFYGACKEAIGNNEHRHAWIAIGQKVDNKWNSSCSAFVTSTVSTKKLVLWAVAARSKNHAPLTVTEIATFWAVKAAQSFNDSVFACRSK
jgi:hypothetical protein